MANTKIQSEQIEDDIALGGNPTTTTQSAGNNTTRVATTAFVTTAVANLVDSAPSALDTLNELAAAMGDDASFSTTITNSIATKLPLAGGTMTGDLNMGSQDITNAGSVTADSAVIDGDLTFDPGGDRSIIGPTNSSLKILANPNATNEGIIFSTDNGTTTEVFIQDGGNVGIGETSPQGNLHVKSADSGATADGGANELVVEGSGNTGISILSGASSSGAIYFGDSGSAYDGYISYDQANHRFIFATNSGPKMYLDTSGNLGIGAASPGRLLEVNGTSNPALRLNNGTDNADIGLASSGGALLTGSTSGDLVIARNGSNGISIGTNGQSRVRIDSSGNLLVNASSTNPTTGTDEGIVLQAGGLVLASNTSDAAIALNRTSSDGDIAIFKKDGSAVGSIGTTSNGIYFGSPSGAGKYFANNGNFSPNTDGSKNLGDSSLRWQDLYLSGGVFLGGTGSANELDDYEEGTFTPVVSGASTAGAFNYVLQQGSYTKVGRLVSFFITIYVTSTSTSPVGSVTLTGLPFTAQNTNNAQYAGSMGWLQNILIGETIGVYVGGSSSTVILRNLTSGGAGGLVQGGDLGNAFYIVVGGQYHV